MCNMYYWDIGCICLPLDCRFDSRWYLIGRILGGIVRTEWCLSRFGICLCRWCSWCSCRCCRWWKRGSHIGCRLLNFNIRGSLGWDWCRFNKDVENLRNIWGCSQYIEYMINIECILLFVKCNWWINTGRRWSFWKDLETMRTVCW